MAKILGRNDQYAGKSGNRIEDVCPYRIVMKILYDRGITKKSTQKRLEDAEKYFGYAKSQLEGFK